MIMKTQGHPVEKGPITELHHAEKRLAYLESQDRGSSVMMAVLFMYCLGAVIGSGVTALAFVLT